MLSQVGSYSLNNKKKLLEMKILKKLVKKNVVETKKP